jgi:hypothetical protein
MPSLPLLQVMYATVGILEPFSPKGNPLPCQYFPLRACLCQLCACTFLAAHQIALCLVHVAC